MNVTEKVEKRDWCNAGFRVVGIDALGQGFAIYRFAGWTAMHERDRLRRLGYSVGIIAGGAVEHNCAL